MKKFLIGIVLLIPIIVVMAITATGTIIAASEPQYPKSIVLKDDKNYELGDNPAIEMDLKGEPVYILIDIYPTIAYDRTAVAEIDEIEGNTGEVELIFVENNKYEIVPKKAGVARLIIMANGDNNVKTALTVNVSTDIMDSITVYDSAYNEVGDEYVLTAPTRFYCEASPLDSLAVNGITWKSEYTDVVRISNAGTLYPMAAGKALVSVSARSKEGSVILKEILINTTASLVTDTVVYSAEESVTAEWVKNYVVIKKGATVEEIGEGKFAVSSNYVTETVTVMQATAGDWGFINLPNTIYTNRSPTYLECAYVSLSDLKDRGDVDCTFTITDGTANATLIGHTLSAVKAGNVTIVATAPDGETRTTVVAVKECPKYFDLALNKENSELGISQTRTWGLQFYDVNGELHNTYQFGCTLNLNNTDVLWTISSHYVTINDDLLLTFLPEAAGSSVTITAAIMAGDRATGVQRSYTFNFCDDKNAINVYSTEEFDKVYYTKYTSIVMQADVKALHRIELTASLYGNGFLVDAKELELSRRDDAMAVIGENVNEHAESITIDNIVIEGADSYENCALRGQGIFAKYLEIPLYIRYCVVRYFNDGIVFYEVDDITIEGCIIGDTNFCAIMMLYTPQKAENANVTLKNCALKKSHGPSIFAGQQEFVTDGSNTMPNLHIEGRLEIYNWKTMKEVGDLLTSMDVGALGGLESMGVDPAGLMNTLSSIIQTLFEHPDLIHLTYVADDGTRYVCMGMLALGTYNYIDPSKITVEDEGIALGEIKMPEYGKNDRSQIAYFVSVFDALVKIADPNMTIKNSSYILSYNFDNHKPRFEPGETVPLNKELYAILNGNY